MDWKLISQSTFFFAVAASLISWVIKVIFKNLINQDLEKFKNELKIDLEKFKNELKIDQIRYSKLQEKRANILIELYYKLDELEEEMQSLVRPAQWAGEPTIEEKMKAASKIGSDFLTFSSRNKIFFGEEVYSKINEINKEFTSIWVDFTNSQLYYKDEPKEKLKIWHDAWKRISNGTVPKLKKEIEKNFRDILGVE